jgi:hypothetical protein
VGDSATSTGTTDNELVAIRMMQDRGLDDARAFLLHAKATTIIETCKWWDAEKTAGRKISKGLLAWKIKQGGVVEVPARGLQSADRRRRFDIQKMKFPLGSSPESHSELQEHKWPHERRCAGRMVVTDHPFPYMTTECSFCRFEAAYLLAKP